MMIPPEPSLGCILSSSASMRIRSKLVDGGGTDSGRYGPDCTHVIVGKLVYDDPICVAARHEGKTLVTGLWVDHSFDIGMPVDPVSIMYRPLREMNGIPGAKSLIVCLTGYQRQDREDIMTMVGLMGANFSKPLVANRVTHLICYKFEGEKYELAKKMTKIKLVNHRWLEDCLRAWELLPEADYDKSGHELEIMEAQAKDSEDEAQDMAKKQHGERSIVATPQNSRSGLRSPCQPLVLKQEASRNILDVDTFSGMSDVGKSNETLLTREKKTTPDRIQLKETANGCSEISGSIAPVIEGKICSGASLNSLVKSSISENISGDLASASRTDRNSPPSSAPKFHSISYSRKTTSKASLPLDLRHVKGDAGSIPMVDISKLDVDDGFNLSSLKIEHERTIFNGAHTPSKETSSHPEDAEIGKLPEKRKVAGSIGISKLQKTCHDSEFVLEGALMANETELPQPTSLTHGPNDITTQHSPRNNYLGFNANLDPSPANVAGIVTPEIVKECTEKAPQTSFEKLKSTCLDRKFPETADVHFNRPEDVVDDATEPQHGPQNLNIPSPGAERVEIQKSDVTAHLDFPIGEDANSRPKPVKRKLLAKKTLGPRPSFGRGKPLTQKGSVYRNKKVSPRNSTTRSEVGKETEDIHRFVDSEKLMVSSNSSADQGKSVEMKNLLECGNQAPNETGLVNNETEASEDEENGLHATVCKGVSGDIQTPNTVSTSKQIDRNVVDMKDQTEISAGDDTSTESENVASHKGRELSELNLEDNAGGEKTTSAKKCPLMKSKKKILLAVTKIDGNVEYSKDQPIISGRDDTSNEAENLASYKRREPSESNLEDNAGGDKATSAEKHPLEKSKKKNLSPMTRIAKSKKGEPTKEAKCKAKCEKTEGKNEKGPVAVREVKPRPKDIEKDSAEMEKENRPAHIGDRNLSHNKQRVREVTPKSDKKSTKTNDGNPGSVSARQVLKVKTEPVWFILSGHKLQRKEFQQVIRRLKGRVCRDTHQWSYQATHFIVPDPIRRTEKLFAAAASGRWILMTDYLTAGNEAGKFLAEEPYEWHKNALSEDGAINLEAPRKWRLLRERTGHGAFYGMRIIIYGDCIVPPLDTLKRVFKAGDGTILATSPPYTRFLQSGVDFAIVSPGMPRVDIWVQEFLRHEIPCVLADYLVEYVCKPGYSLDRHVQYNTHAWAEKSFKKLANSMNEIAEDLTPQEDDGNADIPCQVCGSCDRGEVMLICGDEGGSVGCGIGTHIDCCDPPLEEIPEEDWLCSKCSSKNTQKKSRKLTSTSKKKR